MSGDRRKDVVRHLSEEDIDRLLAEEDDPKIVLRLTFVKNPYEGDTLEEAANRVGKAESTGSRWVRRWNEGGLGQLTPNFGGGPPPKLGRDEQQELLELLRDGQPWKKQEIQHLINEEFDVQFHPVYLSEFLDDLGLSYAIPRTKRPSRPDNANEVLDERVGASLGPCERACGPRAEAERVGDFKPFDTPAVISQALRLTLPPKSTRNVFSSSRIDSHAWRSPT